MRGETEAFCRFTQEPGRFWLDAARAVELTSSVCRVMEQIRGRRNFFWKATIMN